MSKFLIAALVLFPVIVSAQSFNRDLYYGLENDSQVKELQEFLTAQGIYSGPITGNYFSLTSSAVKKFQNTHKISPISGYFGPLSRAKANILLSSQGTSGAPLALEEGVKTQTSVPQQSSPSFFFSLMEQIASLQKQIAALQQKQTSTASVTAAPSLPKLQIIPSPSPSLSPVPTPAVTSPTPTPTVTITGASLQISNVIVTPALTNARIEWQTNIPANSKLFLSGGGLSSKVYTSESGFSTRHVVNIISLTSVTTYSFEIESIAGEQVMKENGTFSTKAGELTLQADKTTIPLTNWHSVNLTAQYTENAKPLPVDISFSAPDDSKTYKVIQNWPACGNLPFLIQLAGATGGGCSADGVVNYQYQPKTLGTHVVSITAKGVTKSVNIEVTTYAKIDAVATGENKNAVLQAYDPTKRQFDEKVIGTVIFSQADEPIVFEGLAEYESDVNSNYLLSWSRTESGFTVTARSNGWDSYSTYSIPIGRHTFTIKGIKVSGKNSAASRTVTGLPIMFAYDVIGISDPEIVPIKTSHIHDPGTQGSRPPYKPGIIGEFKIKMVPNSSILIESYRIRMDNGSINDFTAGIGRSDGTIAVSGYNLSSDTDTTGTSKNTFNLNVELKNGN